MLILFLFFFSLTFISSHIFSLTLHRAYTIHKTLQWYYRWIIDNTEDRIKELRKQKKRILDQVKETETYKVAKELLEKFDPSSEITDSPGRSTGLNSSMHRGKSDANQSLRLRSSISTPSNTPIKSMINSPVQRMPSSATSASFNPNNSQITSNQVSFSPRPLRTFRPILPAERSSISRLIDVVVGDGPSNRYALICCYCHCHNGMALKDEFEYLAYRCCYCNAYNPPRKVRPSAPRIENTVSSCNSDLVINQQETSSENNQLESTLNVKSNETQNDEVIDDVCEEKSNEISERGEECKSEHVKTNQLESETESSDIQRVDGDEVTLTNET